MLTSRHFKTEKELIDWVNLNKRVSMSLNATKRIINVPPRTDKIISIIKDHTNGDWIIFYIEEK